MVLSVTLLGDFSVTDAAGEPLSLPTRKSVALLAYLAVHADRPQPRERLKALLWSDRDEHHARQSLNHALLSIRRLVKNGGPTLLDSSGEQVTLRSEAVDLDVVGFRAALAARPMEAVTLYAGPLLDGLTVPDPVFEDWLGVARSEIHTQLCDALEQGIAAAGDDGNAIELARHLIRLDPVRESGHQHLMRLLYERGDRASALRQYRDCAETLARELAVEPGAATRALFEAINRDDVTPVIVETLAAADAPAVAAAVVPFPKPAPATRRFIVPAVAVFTGLVVGAGAVSFYDRMSLRQSDLNAMVEENARVLAETINREANLESERARNAALTLERAVEAARRQAADTAQQHAEGVVRKHTIESARRQAEELLRQAQEAAKKQVAEIVRKAELAAIAKAEKAAEFTRARQQAAANPLPPIGAPQAGAAAKPDPAKSKSVASPRNLLALAVSSRSADDRDGSTLNIGIDHRPNTAAEAETGSSAYDTSVSTINYEKDRETIKQAVFDYYDVYGHGDDRTDHPKPSLLATVMREIRQVTVERIQGDEVDVSVEYIASTFSGLNETNQRKGRFRLKKQDGSFLVVKMWNNAVVGTSLGTATNDSTATEIASTALVSSIDYEKDRETIEQAIIDFFFMHGSTNEKTDNAHQLYHGLLMQEIRQVTVERIQGNEVDVSAEYIASGMGGADRIQRRSRFRLLKKTGGSFSVVKMLDARAVTGNPGKEKKNSGATKKAGVVASWNERAKGSVGRRQIPFSDVPVPLDARKLVPRNSLSRTMARNDERHDAILAAITNYYFIQGYLVDAAGDGNGTFIGWETPSARVLSVRNIGSGEFEVSVEVAASTVNNYRSAEQSTQSRFVLRERNGEFTIVKMWNAKPIIAKPGKAKRDSGTTEGAGSVASKSERLKSRVGLATVRSRTSTKYDARRDAIAAAITNYYFMQGYPSEATGAGNDTFYGWKVPDVRLLSVRKIRGDDVEVSVEYPASVENNYQSAIGFKKGRFLLRERKGEFAVLKSWSPS